jgi:hypothetical protein
MGLDLLKRRKSINQATHLWLISGSLNNSGSNATASCLEALQQCGLSKFSVSTFGYGSELEFALLKDLARKGKGQFYHVTQQEQISLVFAQSIFYATAVVARNIYVGLRLLPEKVPCELTKIYAKGGTNEFELPDIHANEKKELVFLFKPLYIDLARPVACPVLEVILSCIDNEETDWDQMQKLSIKFEKWEGNLPGIEDSVVHRHWYRVRGADYLREAREFANIGKFREADGVLGRGIEALRASHYDQVPLVQSVLQDMIAARELVQSDDTWQRGGDQHFASISYSHFSQSFATDLRAQATI